MEALTKEDFIEPEQKSENEAASNETKYNEAELFISGILSKTEQEKAKQEKAKQEKAKQEKAQLEKAQPEEAQLEKAKQEKAKQEEAQQEKAKRQKDEEEKAKRQKDEEEKAKKEKAKKENTISSISNYFMKDNVDNIEQRFRDFVKEYGGTDEELKFTDEEFRQIDKAVIKRAIKEISKQSPIPSPQQTAPKISIRTTNALIDVLGKTIKKEKNVKELFDAYNIKINSDEVDRIFNKYFKDGLKEKEIRKYINLESKDNDSENVEFIVNTFAGIGKDDLIKLFETSDIPPLN